MCKLTRLPALRVIVVECWAHQSSVPGNVWSSLHHVETASVGCLSHLDMLVVHYRVPIRCSYRGIVHCCGLCSEQQLVIHWFTWVVLISLVLSSRTCFPGRWLNPLNFQWVIVLFVLVKRAASSCFGVYQFTNPSFNNMVLFEAVLLAFPIIATYWSLSRLATEVTTVSNEWRCVVDYSLLRGELRSRVCMVEELACRFSLLSTVTERLLCMILYGRSMS